MYSIRRAVRGCDSTSHVPRSARSAKVERQNEKLDDFNSRANLRCREGRRRTQLVTSTDKTATTEGRSPSRVGGGEVDLPVAVAAMEMVVTTTREAARVFLL